MSNFTFSLDNPDYLLPHKIGILGLARVLSYCDRLNLLTPNQITYSINPREISLSYECTDTIAFNVLRKVAYSIKDGLIDSPCLEMTDEERFVFSQGLLSSFLQHNMHKKFTGELKEFNFVIGDDKIPFISKARALSDYYYMSAIPQLFTKKGDFATKVQIKSHNFPGMILDETKPEKNLESIDKFLLLFFLPLETPIISLSADLLGQRKGLVLIEPYDLAKQLNIKVPRNLLCAFYSSACDALLSFVCQQHYREYAENLDKEIYVLGSQKWNSKQKFIKKKVVRARINNKVLELFDIFSSHLPNTPKAIQTESNTDGTGIEKTFISSSRLLGFVADNLTSNTYWFYNLGHFLLTKKYYEKHTLNFLIDTYGDSSHKEMLSIGQTAWSLYVNSKGMKTATPSYRSLREKACYLLQSPTSKPSFTRNLSKLFPKELDLFYSKETDWRIIRDCILQSIFLYNFPTSTEITNEHTEQ
jgi:hypothetical protein